VKRLFIICLLSNVYIFANVGMIKNLTGKVEVKRGTKIIILKKGSSVEIGDIIKTKAKSSIGIMFDDGTRLSLGEKAIFVINQFIVKPSKKQYDVDLKLKKGKAIFSSGKIGRLSPQSVKFRIPEGIIGIRGTKFAVEVK